MRIIRYCISFFILFLASQNSIISGQDSEPPFLKYLHHPWVDSVFNSLTPQERIAQLLWVPAFTDRGIGHEVHLSRLITEDHIGGLIFSGDDPEKQVEMINYFQSISKVPLMIAYNGKSKLGIRVNGMTEFPDPLVLAAVSEDSLLLKAGRVIAGQMKRVSVRVILSPFGNVNNTISSTEDAVIAGAKKSFLLKGIRENGVIPGTEGIDIKVNEEDPAGTIKTITKETGKDTVKKEEIDEKCRRVLAAKYWAGLNKPGPVPVSDTESGLYPPETIALIRDLYAGALTLVKNEENIIPLNELQNRKIATIIVNKKGISTFQKRISDYLLSDNFSVDPSDTGSVNSILKKMSEYNLVIAGIYGYDKKPDEGPAVTPEMTSFIDSLIDKNSCIITWFGDPLAAGQIKSLNNCEALMLAYRENEFTEDLSAQLIFGGTGANGTLPVTINEKWTAGSGIKTPGNLRMSYGLPENVGLCSATLERKTDSIAKYGLAMQAYPGCEVMIARKGMVVFHKTYGYHTYDNRTEVRKDDLYDLASVTKVSSTLAGLMLLDSQGKFSPDEKLGYYLPYFKGSDKADLLMKDLLTHQAGLTAWIPFWRETVKRDTVYKKRVYHHDLSDKYPLKVAEGLYINRNYRSKIFREIKKSPLGEKKYVYSDLTFIISTGIIDNLTGERWYDFVTRNIYHRIGAYDLGFNPYKKYSLSRIVPTEYDSLFRKQQLHGTVHDEGAAMLGGISGHAGLFTTANDLMKLMELYRRMGNYGGEQLISEAVMMRYTKYQFPENNNRRGLGFDKPLVNNQELQQKDSYPTRSASPESFGHSGYTGTFVWIDPVQEISYVFLSNRVYPTRNNNKLSELNIRTEILQAIYDSIIHK